MLASMTHPTASRQRTLAWPAAKKSAFGTAAFMSSVFNE